MKYIILLILLMFSTPAKAGFHTGSSIITTGAKNLSPSYNTGYSKLFLDKWVLGFTTNILTPSQNDIRKKGYRIEQKLVYGSVLFGIKSGRSVSSLMVSGVKLDNNVFLGNFNVSRKKIKAVVLGGNVTYFIFPKVAISVSVLLPKDKVGLEFSSAFGINYYF